MFVIGCGFRVTCPSSSSRLLVRGLSLSNPSGCHYGRSYDNGGDNDHHYESRLRNRRTNMENVRQRMQEYERYGENELRGGGYRGGGERDRMSSSLGQNLEKLNWDEMELAPVVKGNYEMSEMTRTRHQQEIQAFREEHRITVVKGDVPNPTMEFHELDVFPSFILEKLRSHGFEKPMPIQAQGWPIALSGTDMIGIGETGSGKTLGFLLPAFVHIENQKNHCEEADNGPIALVLAPTRELAQQIQGVARRFTKIRTACLVGGSHKAEQIRDLDAGAEIVIATPGRLIDMLEHGETNLRRASYVVLDEADRMLDMGFEKQIRQILSQVRPDRQILLWSATWPKEIQNLARDFISPDHSHLNIGSTTLQANKNITQSIVVCNDYSKDKELFKILNSLDDDDLRKILIFSATKSRVDMIANRLRRIGFNCEGIHGNKTQAMRNRILSNFRSGRTEVLVATNVAARGLDVDDIKVVINYDYPQLTEDYVHRIGRTGRKGLSGKSFTLLTEKDSSLVPSLIDVLEDAGQEVSDELVQLANFKQFNRRAPKKANFKQNRHRNNYEDDYY